VSMLCGTLLLGGELDGELVNPEAGELEFL
jgi:hypothetical protein